MTEDEKEYVSYKKARKKLPKTKRIHTFRVVGPIRLGCDIDKKRLKKMMKKFKKTLEITGPNAQSMNHGLALIDETGALFIETIK